MPSPTCYTWVKIPKEMPVGNPKGNEIRIKISLLKKIARRTTKLGESLVDEATDCSGRSYLFLFLSFLTLLPGTARVAG